MDTLNDGAVVQENRRVTAIGPFAEFAAAHPDLTVIGTGDSLVIPGLVNTRPTSALRHERTFIGRAPAHPYRAHRASVPH